MRIDHILHKQKDNIDLFKHVFESFPNKDFWKFGIDRKDHYRGKYAYDLKEKNYMNAYLSGINFISQNINNRINMDFIHKLHSICVNNIIISNLKEIGSNRIYKVFENISTNYGPSNENSWISFGFDIKKCSIESKKELISNKLINLYNNDDPSFISYYNYSEERIYANIGHYPKNLSFNKKIEYSISRCTICINTYYQELSDSKNKYDKLKAIVKLIRFLNISHVFEDGNRRTNNILLIKLLIENGFYPCILKYTEILEGYLSISEVIPHIVEGIEYFQNLKKI